MREQCIRAVSANLGRELTQDEANGIENRIRDALRQLKSKPQAFAQMDAPTRLQEAARIAAANIKQDAFEAKRRAQITVGIHDRIGEYYQKAVAAGMDPQEALHRMLNTEADGRSTVQSQESKTEGINRDYARRLVTLLEQAHPRMLGLFANREGAQLVTRELYGEDTGSSVAKAAAKEWGTVIDQMVAHFRDLGGTLHRLDDWRFPQHHDSARVFGDGSVSSRESWVDSVLPKLNRERYIADSGRIMVDTEVRDVLRDVWDTIATNGANKIDPGAPAVGGRMVANRYSDHRFLHFKDASSWLDYQGDYGSKDLWAVMTGHVNTLSRNIAAMDTWGPNPDAMFGYWNAKAALEARHSKTNVHAVQEKNADAFRYAMGYSAGVSNAMIAGGFAAARNVASAALLNSAILSSFADTATLALTAAYNRQSIFNTFLNGLRTMNPLAKGARAEAARAGLMIESTMNSIRRFQVDALGPSFSARLSDVTMRASGLTAWTDGWRAGFGLTRMHALASIMRGEIDPADLKLLRAHGVTDTDLAVWRAAQPTSTRFGPLLTAESIYRVPDAAIEAIKLPRVGDVDASAMSLRREAAMRLLGMLVEEQHMAVVEPGYNERLQMSSGRPRGELKGELLQSFWQFKSFPWSVFRKHLLERGTRGQDTAGGKALYIGPLVVASTLLGAAALAADDLLNGRDPRPFYGANGQVLFRNWVSAFLKGGALGVWGDYLGGELQGQTSSALATLAGPLGSGVHDALQLTVGNAIQHYAGQETHIGAEAVRFAKRWIPFQNMWYTKAATDHIIFQQLQDLLTPGTSERSMARAAQMFGQKYFWPQATTTPARAPNLAHILGQ